MRQIELREYGYTKEWRKHRGLDGEDRRTRGVIAQELAQIFPEHVEILPELVMGDIKFDDFYQVDKQGLVLDCKCRFIYTFIYALIHFIFILSCISNTT